jgi:Mn-dependent DtxR family transcriptional regulator
MDRLSMHGPWTAATIRLIGERPRTRAGDLADSLGRERLPFKADVRKLKYMGLTRSLEVGYELTEAGERVLALLEQGTT